MHGRASRGGRYSGCISEKCFFSATIMHFWFGKCSFGQNDKLDPAIGGMVRSVDASKFLATI